MYLVGLTGGIASGKSTVSKKMQELGCPCVDADLIARQVVEPGTSAYKKIRMQFGCEVFHQNGQLNREKLGQIVFTDVYKRKQLNSITHPAIKKRMLWEVFLLFLKGHQFVILDVPLLFETKQMLPFISYSIVVFCDEEQQLHRLMERNNLSEEEAVSRIKAQLPLKEKCDQATFVIDNTESKEKTYEQVLEVHQKLKASNKHLPLRLGLLAGFVGIISCVWWMLYTH